MKNVVILLDEISKNQDSSLFIIGVVSILVTVIGILIATLLTARMTKKTKQQSWAQLLHMIRQVYASPEMLSGMKNLIAWYEEYGKVNFANKFAELRRTNSMVAKKLNLEKKVDTLDQDRRRFAHFVIEVWQLYDLKIIDKKFVKLAIPITPANFAIVIDEPMEIAINKDYNRAPFDLLRKIYGNKLTGELLMK